jgi:hypothetical protein
MVNISKPVLELAMCAKLAHSKQSHSGLHALLDPVSANETKTEKINISPNVIKIILITNTPAQIFMSKT